MSSEIDFLPEEKEGMMKAICSGIATEALRGSSSTFLPRLIVLTDIYNAWKEHDLVTVSISKDPNKPLISKEYKEERIASPSPKIKRMKIRKSNDKINTHKTNIITEEEVKTSTERQIFCCEHCGKLCMTAQRLRVHIETTHLRDETKEILPPQMYECYICGRQATTPELLRRHMWVHTGEKRCVCSRCGKQFSRPELLKRHHAIHTGQEPYSCPYCTKKFVFNQHLKKHIRIHTGEKPYVCEVCSRGYANPETLRKHLDIQHGISPP